jgi:hypothetical protein
MKRPVIFAVVLLQALSLFPQETVVENLAKLDEVTAGLGNLVGARLEALGKDAVVRVGTFTLRGSNSTLGSYWSQQLLGVLLEKTGRSYSLLGPGGNNVSPQAYLLSGEILQIENIIRIYTRLGSVRDGRFLSSWTTDLRRNNYTDLLLRVIASPPSPAEGAPSPDPWEPDGRENPLAVEIGGPRIERTIHGGDDADWFSVTADRPGTLIFETFGNLDTIMELYDGAGGGVLDENDDGGSGSNAKITVRTEGGKTFLIMVKGYSRSDTGGYQFQVRYRPDDQVSMAFPKAAPEARMIFSSTQ